jgi:hypothetical protein
MEAAKTVQVIATVKIAFIGMIMAKRSLIAENPLDTI